MNNKGRWSLRIAIIDSGGRELSITAIRRGSRETSLAPSTKRLNNHVDAILEQVQHMLDGWQLATNRKDERAEWRGDLEPQGKS